MNNLLNSMKQDTNYTYTENGGLTHKTTNSALMDMFAMGAAMRNRSVDDILFMFAKAYAEDKELAMKMLFYLRDVRGGGQGERRFFRECIKWLSTSPMQDSIRKNMKYIPEFGRWDDLYAFVGTPLEYEAMKLISDQLKLDVDCKTPSLLAKWLKSENASSKETRRLGNITRSYFGMSHKEYRATLSMLRARINIVERLMSANRWDEIEFDKIPSKAGLIYKNAFARRDIIKEKYKAFAKDTNTKVNAGTLYPYEVVEKAIKLMFRNLWTQNNVATDNVDRLMINKYWDNLTDYFNGATLDALCMIDTSGSMQGTPINVATSIGLYCAERNLGPWHNHYISFSSKPQLIETSGIDFCDKVYRIVRTNLCENTNIEAAFDLILKTAVKNKLLNRDLPKNIIVISDMEFDMGTTWYDGTEETVMESIKKKFNHYGYTMPHLIYWNVDARQNNIPMLDDGPITYVSGFSPSIFTAILTGKTGYDLMLEAITNERYACIHA